VDRSNGKAKFDAKFYSVMEMDVQTYAEADIPASLAAVPVSKPGSRGLQG
jgi:orotate phosphoribosyltransferase